MRFVKLLVTSLMLGQAILTAGVEDHDHLDAGKGNGSSGKTSQTKRKNNERSNSNPDEGCRINSGDLANFANGESYNFKSVVTFLTHPACQGNARSIGLQEMRSGIQFNRVPFHLDNFAKGYGTLSLESVRRIEGSLANSIPGMVREGSIANNELLPVLGQLAILSPKAARNTLSYLIESELISGDENIEKSKRKKEEAAIDLASSLMQMGANENLIIAEIADSIEEKAVLGMADSLGKILRGLANAARAEQALAPTFNVSASAFNRGVQRGKSLYQPQSKSSLILATFLAIQSSAGLSAQLEPGAQELNEALNTLMESGALADSSIRKLWRAALKVLSISSSQSALADAVALSLGPEALFINPQDRAQLLEVAKNYASVGQAIQECFIEAWNIERDKLFEGQLKTQTFNRNKELYFEPWVAGILELEPVSMNPRWLKEVINRGLVQDEDIEKKFPRFVLSLMSEGERASKGMVMEAGAENLMNSAFHSFNMLWTLSNIHVPALNKWVKKYEE